MFSENSFDDAPEPYYRLNYQRPYFNALRDVGQHIIDELTRRLNNPVLVPSSTLEKMSLRSLLHDAIEAVDLPNHLPFQAPFHVIAGDSSRRRQFRKFIDNPMTDTGADADPEDAGISLLLHDEIFEILSSPDATSTDEIDRLTEHSLVLQRRLRATFPRLEAQLGHELTALLKETLDRPIVFHSYHWMRLVHSEQYWATQDCVGTTILHFILEHLKYDFPGEKQTTTNVRYGLLARIRAGSADLGNHPKDIQGRTLLHTAIQFDLLEITSSLLERGVDLRDTNFRKETPLHFAAVLGRLEICKILWNKRPDNFTRILNAKDIKGNTALHHAARKGRLDVVNFLLSLPEIDINVQDELGNSPLMTAIWHNEDESIYKVAMGCPELDVHIVNKQQQTALHMAMIHGRVSAIQELSGEEYDLINMVDKHGVSPLHHAASRKIYLSDQDLLESVLDLLLANEDIDAGQPAADGRTALFYAAELGNVAFCRIIATRVDSGIFKRFGGETPQEVASRSGHHGIADVLEFFEIRADRYWEEARLAAEGESYDMSNWVLGNEK